MKAYKLKCIVLSIIAVIMWSACANSEPVQKNEAIQYNSTAVPDTTLSIADFKELCDELFVHIAASDAITLNYTLSSPETYGIHEYPDSLGNYGTSSMQAEYAYLENKLDILKRIDPASFSTQEKITYDTLYETLSSYIKLAPFFIYEEPLAPVSGIHVQLPVLLSEYHFYNEKSIQNYFSLIESIPAYFTQILKFEAQKKSEGIFMGVRTAEKVISECEDFISNPESNMLIQIFNQNISSLNLSDSSRSEYISRNEQLIREVLIPAYSNIINGVKSLVEFDDTPSPAMCSLPDGKEYYEQLVHIQTGSDKKPESIKALLEQTIKDCRTKIASTILDHPDAYKKIDNISYAASEPEDIINYLIKNITKEYPSLTTDAGRLNIKYVHPSLENTLSPAMYITPPIDCNVTDDIYINRSCIDDSSMFPTLAHEGYPGHLYQYEYYMSTGPHPLRLVLSFGGYCEGWATYAEIFSYDIAGIDTVSATILKNSKLATLCMYSMLDLGIHYYGWSYEKCSSYLSEFGIDNKENIDEIYGTIIAEPALYLKYTVGCLEFIQLENEIKAAAGTDYDPVIFHKAVLETGPTWFEILKNNVKNTYFHR